MSEQAEQLGNCSAERGQWKSVFRKQYIPKFSPVSDRCRQFAISSRARNLDNATLVGASSGKCDHDRSVRFLSESIYFHGHYVCVCLQYITSEKGFRVGQSENTCLVRICIVQF